MNCEDHHKPEYNLELPDYVASHSLMMAKYEDHHRLGLVTRMYLGNMTSTNEFSPWH